jgi:hypothetical protein
MGRIEEIGLDIRPLIGGDFTDPGIFLIVPHDPQIKAPDRQPFPCGNPGNGHLLGLRYPCEDGPALGQHLGKTALKIN